MSSSEASDLLREHNKNTKHGLHILFTSSQPDACGLTSLPPSSSQGIIVSVNDFCNIPVVLAHELGHFFMLQHTQEGFGTPEKEMVSRDEDNCLYKGDGLCDTPADPTLSSSNVNNKCEYHGHLKDREVDGEGDDAEEEEEENGEEEEEDDREVADGEEELPASSP